ncbi:MAG: glycosyltransferase family 2 protein [Alphaproteobacteria bacterium]
MKRFIIGGICVGILVVVAGVLLCQKRPTVSVVMPVYNRADTVGEAIESILNQTYRDFEFIIVDDGSTDNTPTVLKEYADKDSRIRIITHPENRGISAARNTAQEKARGTWLAIMDSDDVALPIRLEKQLTALAQNPDIDALTAAWETLEKGVKKEWLKNPKEYSFVEYQGRFPVGMFFTNCYANVPALIRRDFVKKHGITYKTDLSVGEDYDYWLQMIFAGAKLARLNQVTMLVRSGGVHAVHQNERLIEDTYRIKKNTFAAFLGDRPVGMKWAYSLKEQCDLLKGMIVSNTMKHLVDAQTLEGYYNRKCAPNEPHKLFLSHPHWNGILVLQGAHRAYRWRTNNKGNYEKGEGVVTVSWDAYPKETFVLKGDGIYYFLEKNQRLLRFSHPYWQDIIIADPQKICRTQTEDCAQIVSQEGDKIVIKWDSYGQETFVLNPKTQVYECQKETAH